MARQHSGRTVIPLRHLSSLLTTAAMLTLLVPAAGAATLTPVEAQRHLKGTWAGDGTTLTIDTDRLQGNVDPTRPFDWHPFRLLNVSGRMVVFDIGEVRFLAMLEPVRTMRLTSPAFTGERALHLVRR